MDYEDKKVTPVGGRKKMKFYREEKKNLLEHNYMIALTKKLFYYSSKTNVKKSGCFFWKAHNREKTPTSPTLKKVKSVEKVKSMIIIIKKRGCG